MGTVEGDTRTVLVVEDEDGVRRVVVRVVEAAGYRVISACEPDEALTLLDGVLPDAVVTDVSMPHGGGTRLVQELRKRRPELPVVFMTGYAPDDEGLEGVVLLKPFRPNQLLDALKKAFG